MHRALAETILRTPRTQEALLEVLRQLPDDIDVELATLRIMQVLSPTTVFIEVARTFPPAVIQRVLAHIPRAAKPDAEAIFLAEAVRVAGDWSRGLDAFAELGTFEATPRKRGSRARVLVKQLPLLLAAQAAVASEADNQTRGLLELLAADGSEASVDALLAELQRAEATKPFRLLQLWAVLQDGARTPRMEEMKAAMRERHPFLPG